MMLLLLLLLKKNLSFTYLPSIIPKNTTPLRLLRFPFSSASATQNPPPKSNFITDYLITSFGFSPQKAFTASKPLLGRFSTENANSVRHFLKHHGFADSQIRAMVSCEPTILYFDVENTLKPNLQALRSTRYFSGPELQRLIAYHPRILIHSRPIPRLEFWKEFLNGDTKKLLSAFVRNAGLICQDIDTGVAPKISLLKDYGLSQTDIGIVLIRGPGLLRRSVTSMEVLLKRVQELGFPPGSLVFVRGLVALSGIGLVKFKTRQEFFKSFGWLERDFLDALRKFPHMLCLSEQNIQQTMEFLVGRAGCEQSYIASNPTLLGYSLEKRLMPRHHVMNILKSSKLVGRERSLYSIMSLSEKSFFDKVILPNTVQVPKLRETYVAACASQIPI